ncbi:MAG: lantibiotic immunity ABC transporter MutE/EpiE family permease subunit [Lactobacillus sp.]|nr:lantibiotic immunity ABC transporter MutE/EpiE family permease subunit [Lactobacillus sp.]
MLAIIKAEFLKEKRAANAKLLLIAPVIFIGFILLLNLLMGPSPKGKSYLVAAAFNWWPMIILPAMITLMVANICDKEKSVQQIFLKSTGIPAKSLLIAKNLIIFMETLVILVILGLLVFFIGKVILQQDILGKQLLKATICLFVGSLPIIEMSFLAKRYFYFLVIIIANFVLSIVGAVVAVKSYWWLFPWSYNLRMMAPLLGIHPNGTFLNTGDSLLNLIAVPQAIISASIWSICLLALQLALQCRGEKHDSIN